MYTPKETVDAEKAIRSQLIEWKRSIGWEESWNGPVHIRLYCLYEPSGRKKQQGGFEYVYGPDVDNAVKTFLDAAQDKTIRHKKKDEIRTTFVEGILTNDCRVSSVYVRKVYSDLPTGALLIVEFHAEQFPINRPKRTIDRDTVKPLQLDCGQILGPPNGGISLGESTTPEADQAEDAMEDF